MADEHRPASIAPAAHRVFALPELSESIFLYLTPSEVLTKALQVCKAWLRVIAHSTALQELLFLRPISASTPCCDHANGMWRDKDLAIIENPFAPLLSHPEPPAPFALPSASWRRMLLTQPPVTVVRSCSREDWADLASVTRNAGVQLGDLPSPIYGIKGSSEWLTYEHHGQLQAVKDGLKPPGTGDERIARADDEAEWEDYLGARRGMCCSTWSACV